jgi:competence ComEA-like helix-hairpin-helix protein
MFNRREQVALLLLTGSLLAGSGLALVDYYHASTLEEFRVLPGEVDLPAAGKGSVGETTSVIEGGEVDGWIELNGATALQLQSLPSIGPKTAARILAHRQEHGPFLNLEGLQKVSGIGPRTIEKLRSRLRVGDADL